MARFVRKTTPVGTLVFPHLTAPDNKFNSDGVYHTRMALTEDQVKDLQAAADAVLEAFIESDPDDIGAVKLSKAVTRPVGEEECDQDGNETGRFLVRFKMNATGKGSRGVFTRQPALFDAKAQSINFDEAPDIWSGTKARISYELVPYYMASTKSLGVSLRLRGVQIIELATSGTGGGASMGFEEEEGYVATARKASDDMGFESSEDVKDDDDF